MKKIFSLFFIVTLCLSTYMSALAAEGNNGTSDIPKNIKKTTITYEMGINDGIQPLIWDDGTWETNKQSAWTPFFTIPDRYFAYEITATSGNSSGKFAVALVDNGGATIHSITQYANGNMKKADWITVVAGRDHQFEVTNLTGSYLRFYISYYSWK